MADKDADTEHAQSGELADARRRIAELRQEQRLYRELSLIHI